MAYCALEDIKAIIPEETLLQLTDDEGLGVLNQERIDEAIANADAMIDSYAAGSGRYVVPFAPVPRLIKVTSHDIAIYNLYCRRENVPEVREKRYTNAVKILEKLLSGQLAIGEAIAPAAPTGAEARMRTRAKIFGDDTLEHY